MTPFPWAEAMRLGLGILRLAPESFWAMTPRELSAAAAGLTGPTRTAAPSRDRLADLLKQFPDTEADDD